jgi:MtN3 and saliva related transmembrane protein
MTDIHIGVIGIIAGIFTTSSFIPQIVKIVRTQRVRDLSLMMFLLCTAGIIMWLIYGMLIRELPIILANSVGLGFCGFILGAKIWFGKKDRR